MSLSVLHLLVVDYKVSFPVLLNPGLIIIRLQKVIYSSIHLIKFRLCVCNVVFLLSQRKRWNNDLLQT